MEKRQLFSLEQIPEDWENTPPTVKRLVETLIANTTLSENESRLIQFLDATPIGIAVHDSTGQIIYINQVGRSLLGNNYSSQVDLPQFAEFFRIYQAGTNQLYPIEALPSSRALTGEAVWIDDLEIHHADRIVPLEVWATPIFDDQKQVIYAIAAFQDISERKQLKFEYERRQLERQIFENTLLKSDYRRYRQVIQAQTDLILRSLPDTTITFANDALCLAIGCTLEEVIGTQWSSFVPPKEINALHNKIAALTPDNPIFENINQDYRLNDQIGWTHWVNLGIFAEHGELLEIQSVGRDITELQEKILREQALNRVLQAIHNSLDLHTIFATATAETAQLLNLDCFVVQYLPDLSLWRHIAEFRHDPNTPNMIGFEIPDAGNPFSEQLKQLQPVQVEDTSYLSDAVNREVAQVIPGAWLLIPLAVEGKLWGSFTISTTQHPSVWQDEQVELAQSVADQLEVAIQQANLYQQVQLELEERRRIETALRESETRFQNMAANVPGAIFRYVLRPDGSDSVLYMSPGCQRLWEVEAQDVVADASILWQMIDPEDLPIVYNSVMESARTVSPWVQAWRIRTPSGREKWLEAAGKPIRQPTGDVIWDTLILDISERKRSEAKRKQAEIALKESEYRYAQILDSVQDMVFCKSPGSVVVYANKATCDYYGMTLQQLQGITDVPYNAADYTQQYLRDDLQVFTTGQTVENLEEPNQRADGEVRYFHTIKSPIFDRSGTVVQLVGVSRDITERMQAETALKQSEQRFRHLFEYTPKIAVQGYNSQRQVIYWNNASEQLYGYAQSEALGQQLEDLIIPPEMRQEVINNIRRWLTEGQPIPAGELSLMRKDGSRVAVYSSHILLTNTEGEPEIYCVDIDLSDRKQAEEALRDSENRYRLLAENMNDLVCLHDLQGRYLYVSPSCELLLGYRYDEMLGQDPYLFFHPDDCQRIYQETHAAALSRKPTPTTYRIRQKSGQYIWFETLTKPILNASGQIVQLQTTSRDVTARIEAQNQLKHDALHDALTGLPNRHLLMERLELAISRAKRFEDYRFAVLFLDLDRFKVINDSLGHLAGDQLLIAIAQKLQFTLRSIDLAARLGGDEFVILLEDVKDIQEAVRATERIFAALQTPLMLEEREVYTTSSIGIVFGSKDYGEASHLLRDADIAMYRAKNKGKARYEIFDAAMHTQALNRLHLENDLRRAIEYQEFVLHYQPLVALDTGSLAGFEALIRWRHPTQGLKAPGEFIAVAEETGLITRLDYWALQTACHQLATWQSAFPELAAMKMSVNLSAQDLQRFDLLQEVDRILAQTGLPGRCLMLELTESMLIEDIESTITLLSQLKERGIQISIDDFGTGYSSLNYLHRLPVDNLKVDRSFVNQIQVGKRNHQIVETIVALSNQLELDAIAEGIETQQQLERLQYLGYKFGQGYLFSKPLSQEATETLLASRSWHQFFSA